MDNNKKAICLMVVAMSALATNDAIMRWVGEGVPVAQMIFLRGLFFIGVLYCGSSLISNQHLALAQMLNKWCILRGIAELTATYLFITSLSLIPIATATMLVFIAPIIITLMSIFIFKENVGPWRLIAVLAGFLGTTLIIFPDLTVASELVEWNYSMLLPLGAALLVAIRDISTRMIGKKHTAASVSMTSAIIACVGGLVGIPFEGWVHTSGQTIVWMAFAGMIIAVSHFTYVVSIQHAELSVLAPIQYVIILWAVLFGWLIWMELPNTKTTIGAIIIITSGLIIVYREHIVRHKDLNSNT